MLVEIELETSNIDESVYTWVGCNNPFNIKEILGLGNGKKIVFGLISHWVHLK